MEEIERQCPWIPLAMLILCALVVRASFEKGGAFGVAEGVPMRLEPVQWSLQARRRRRAAVPAGERGSGGSGGGGVDEARAKRCTLGVDSGVGRMGNQLFRFVSAAGAAAHTGCTFCASASLKNTLQHDGFGIKAPVCEQLGSWLK